MDGKDQGDQGIKGSMQIEEIASLLRRLFTFSSTFCTPNPLGPSLPSFAHVDAADTSTRLHVRYKALMPSLVPATTAKYTQD